MKAATILPQPYLYLVKDEPYHLALAHLISKPGFEQYTEFYQNIGQQQDKFLILDNGLIEGDPRPIEELVEKAHLINADELVLPDVFQHAMATITATYHALAYCRRVAPDLRVMAVPQGKTYEEWLDCAREMLSWGVDTISVPKVVTKMTGRDGRLQALIDLQSELERTGTEVHLLGCWESPLELKIIENYVRQGKIKPVRGVDSAIAYVYARAGLKMSEAERPPGAIDFSAEDADLEILKYNIEMWKSECAALPPLGNENKVHRIF